MSSALVLSLTCSAFTSLTSSGHVVSNASVQDPCVFQGDCVSGLETPVNCSRDQQEEYLLRRSFPGRSASSPRD